MISNILENKNLSYEEYNKSQIACLNSQAGKLNEQDGYNCDICLNRGNIYVLIDGDIATRQCECLKIRSMIQRANKSGLAESLSKYKFSNFEIVTEWQEVIKQLAMDFCKDETARWFFIGGQVGAGKTHLCTAICAYYIKAGYDVQYMLWVEESKKLKALVNQNSEYQNIIEKYKRADVLYIDDFLKTKANEAPTNGDINLAFEIINNRYLNTNKITIISCERVLNDLLRFDEATASRIYEAVGKYNIEIGKDEGKNHRIYPNRPVGA